MSSDFLDRVLGGVGLTMKPTNEAIRNARDAQLGNMPINPGRGSGPDANNPGGLIPAYDAMVDDRDRYVQDFTTERDRILSQVDQNRQGQQTLNDAALEALPGLTEGATADGYLSRVRGLADSDELAELVAGENAERMRQANAMLSAGGLSRSGAAATAAADATDTTLERAFQIEPELYRRGQNLTNLYRDLPIANQMVLDTYQRDMAIADNLTQQGETRSQAELLMGQASKEATENLLLNLIQAYGAATQDGGINIVNDISNSISDLLGDIITRGGNAVSGAGEWLGGVLDDIFGDDVFDDSDGGITLPPYIPPVFNDNDNPDPGVGGGAPGGPTIPPIDGVPGDGGQPADQPPVDGVPAEEPTPADSAAPASPPLTQDGQPFPEAPGSVPDRQIGGQWYRWVDSPGGGGNMQPIPEVLLPTVNPDSGQQPVPAPEPEPEAPVADLPPINQPDPQPPTTEPDPVQPWETDVPDFLQNAEQTFNSLLEQGKIGEDGYMLDENGNSTDMFWTDVVRAYRDALIAARDQQEDPALEVPGLPDLGVGYDPDSGVRDPDQDFDDLLGSLPFPDIGDISPGAGFGGNGFAPSGSGQAPPVMNFPGWGTMVLGEISGYGGREVGDDLFGRKATTSWGSNVGTAVGYHFGGPIGAAVGGFVGGLVDSAFGTSDQKNVTVGVATTQPGDDISGERELASGLKLWGINRRGGDGEMTSGYMDTLEGIDSFLTESAKLAGYDVKLRNFGDDIPTFGGEVEGKGKNLNANPTFFGSATEGSEETTREAVTSNLVNGYDKFVDAWLQAAVDQGQIPAELIEGIEGDTTRKLLAFQNNLGYDVEVPDLQAPAGGFDNVNPPNNPFELPALGGGVIA